MEEASTRPLADWRQGDVVSAPSFLSVGLGNGGQAERRTDSVDGWVVITQTCDLVRDPSSRPSAVVVPLVELDETLASPARLGFQPRYAATPLIGPRHFADLDAAMTVDKALLVQFKARRGFNGDESTRRFSAAVARKFGRTAFPDDLNPALEKFRSRLVKKARGSGPEAELLARVSEIRAQPAPHWDADLVDVTLTFILDDDELVGTDEVPEASPEIARLLAGVPDISMLASTLVSSKSIVDRTHLWERLVAAWVGLCKPVGTIRSIDAEVATADDYTIRRYRDSDQLDLEYLSQSASDEEVDD